MRLLSAEMITALTAMAIGIGAVAVSLYETSLIRQQLKGSAWPNMEAGFSYSEDGFRYILMISAQPICHWIEGDPRCRTPTHKTRP
jgi:hypothetical protein